MKRHVIHYSLFIISLCAPAYAQIAQRWISEASRPTAQEITIYRGETLALEPTITVHGTPYAWPDETEVTLWWQSSNMGASWWSTPAALGTATGALRAVWSPACDSGADRYTFFIRASAPSGIAYRASGTLIMRHSPGAVPNALPLPTPAIDFASIEIHNAPWLFESDWQSGSNALAGAVQQAAQTMQADAQAALDTFAATNIVTRLEAVDGSQWIDGTGAVWRVSYGGGGYWTISVLGTLYGSATNAYYEVRSAPFDFWNYDQAFWDGDAYFRWFPDGDPGSGHVYVEVQGVEETHDYNYPTNDLADGVFEFYTSATYTHFVLAWSNDLASVSTQRVDGLAWQSDLPLYATTQQVAAALAPMATTQHVAEAIAAIPVPDLSSRVAVQSGHATNLAVSGWLALPQSQPTNLTMRLVASNDVIMAIGVIQ